MINQNGTAIIFDGLSERRFELSRYLNSIPNRRVTIVEALSEKYDDDLSLELNLNEQRIRNAAIEAEALQSCTVKLRKDYEGLHEMLDKVCLSCAASFFSDKLDSFSKKTITVHELMAAFAIKEEFSSFVLRLLMILEEHAYITNEDGIITVTKSLHDIPEIDVILQQFSDEQRTFMPYVELLLHCSSEYGRIFQGDIPANEVLYPNGEFSMVDDVDKRLPQASKRSIYGEILARIIKDMVHTKKKKVRILEIGAGTGELTYKIMKQLTISDHVEYYFTDIGQSFVATAKFEAQKSGNKMMKFAKLDISVDIERQGFHANSFDIIIGYDVLQATESVERSLLHVKKLLVPGGILAQIQSYGDQHVDNLIYGLSPGWWNFTKDPLRGSRITMLPSEWREALNSTGFHCIQSLPDNSDSSDCVILLSQNAELGSNEEKGILYDRLKNERFMILKSLHEQCSIEFVPSFAEEDVQEYMRQAKQRDGSVEILFQDRPQDHSIGEYHYGLDADELKLIQILETVVGAKQIRLEDELHDIGLDSLSGLLFISKLKEAFLTEITIKDFYRFKFVGDLAEHIKHADRNDCMEQKEEEQQINAKDMDELFDFL
ncbi:methyltransferase [Paenibacillus sp. MER 180]|uniref:methyltransferase n=1 Tax=unclassified Paenibacillus TaxID=185978 RepID=UPI00080668E2|nr:MULTISPECIES: methyltransferase domain-containing protein [unclassified Paenibacillus]MCM3291429.1 methyltransferase [Paenibacillus sp. MER 180]OBY77565.1 ubiquinone/menaquinone biosynthesis protein [Paenibacillus sp. KS1]